MTSLTQHAPDQLKKIDGSRLMVELMIEIIKGNTRGTFTSRILIPSVRIRSMLSLARTCTFEYYSPAPWSAGSTNLGLRTPFSDGFYRDTFRPDDISVVPSHNATLLDRLNTQLRQFWEIGKLLSAPSLTPAEERCEYHFRRTHSRNEQGQYIVHLPFSSNRTLELDDSLTRGHIQPLVSEI